MLKYILVTIAMTLAASANTNSTPQIYLVNGKQTTGKQALLAAMEEKEVHQCKRVEAVLSKGSVRLRTLKIK